MRKTAALTVIALGVGLLAPTPYAVAADGDTATLTVVSTTDLHGYMRNWDYFKDAEYSDRAGNTIGLANAASAIDSIRAERGEESVIVVDNGDFLQGSSLATYYAKQEPITSTGATHPVAASFNAVGYDVVNLGNHEFNYGVDYLRAFEGQVDAPLLGANVIDVATGEPAFTPYQLVRRTIGDATVTVGFLGLTTPGSMIWDKGHLDGKIEIRDMVASAKTWVPKVREAGADIVVVMAHAGIGTSSYDVTDRIGAENPADKIAEQVPGIDAIVIGHTHREAPEQWVANAATGEQVLITQPYYWGRAVSDLQFQLEQAGGKWKVTSKAAQLRYSKDYEPSQAVLDATAAGHEATVAYVNQRIANSVAELPATQSRYRDTAIIDYIQMVQTETVKEALAGTEYAKLPVLSLAAPFSRTAVFPQGDVSIRDMAALYIYDNTLEAVVMDASQVRDFLEWSAKYFAQVQPGEEFDPETMTSVVHDGQQVWDYMYDIVSGLNYEIDLSKPVGERIQNMTHADGTPVADDERFVVAANNYRRSGGGNFPHISTAPVVYNDLLEIRQLLIDWAVEHGTIDQRDFFTRNWRLTIAGEPIFADEILDVEAGEQPTTPVVPSEPGQPSTPAVPVKPGLPKTGR